MLSDALHVSPDSVTDMKVIRVNNLPVDDLVLPVRVYPRLASGQSNLPLVLVNRQNAGPDNGIHRQKGGPGFEVVGSVCWVDDTTNLGGDLNQSTVASVASNTSANELSNSESVEVDGTLFRQAGPHRRLLGDDDDAFLGVATHYEQVVD
jgi:hypothetical protein